MAKNTGLTRSQLRKAPAITLNVAGTPVVASPRQFSTGSMGWFANGKARVEIAPGVFADCQVSSNITVIASKPGDMPEGE